MCGLIRQVIMLMLILLDRFYCKVHCHQVTSIMCGVPSFWCVQILVSSIEVNKDTLKCSVQPLDLITQFDGKPVDSLCDQFGWCELIREMTLNSVNMWVARISGIPHIAYLQSE